MNNYYRQKLTHFPASAVLLCESRIIKHRPTLTLGLSSNTRLSARFVHRKSNKSKDVVRCRLYGSLKIRKRCTLSVVRKFKKLQTFDMRFEKQSDMLNKAQDLRAIVQLGYAPVADNS
jgi:hypothetical protein